MNEVLEFLKKCGTYYIATVDGNKARVRPFGTIELFEDKLYIQTGKSKVFAKQVAANPSTEICGVLEGKWIRVEATLVLDDNEKAQQHMLDAYPSLKGRYAIGDGNIALYYLKDATATISSFSAPPQVIKF